QVVSAVLGGEALGAEPAPVAAEVRGNNPEQRRQNRNCHRPVEVGGGEKSVDQQNGRSPGGSLLHTHERRAAARKVDEPARGHLVRKVKVAHVEPLQPLSWPARGTEWSRVGLAEPFSPPRAPGRGGRGGRL